MPSDIHGIECFSSMWYSTQKQNTKVNQKSACKHTQSALGCYIWYPPKEDGPLPGPPECKTTDGGNATYTQSFFGMKKTLFFKNVI